METKEIELDTLFTFSHSGLSAMEKCTYSWFLKYIEKIRPDVRKPATEFGKLLHKTMELYKGYGKEEILGIVEKVRPEFKIEPEYEIKMDLALTNFIKFYDKYLSKAKKIAREKEFKTILTKDIGLVGSLDVLYLNENDEWIVVDYKTSKRKNDESKQLSMYYFLMTLVTGKKPKKLKCQIVYLSMENKESNIDNFVEEYTLDESDLDFCEDRISAAMRRISNLCTEKENWKKKPGPLCPWCDFYIAKICDGKNDQQETHRG